MKFYVRVYSFVVSTHLTELSYVVGSNSRKVSVDGVASDWGSSVPLVGFQASGNKKGEPFPSFWRAEALARELFGLLDAF